VKQRYFILGFIVLLGLFLRLYSLGEPPLWIDEAISSIAVENLIEDGHIGFDSGLHYGRAYVHHITQAFFMLFGMNDFTARLASVLFGVAMIVLAYFIGREYSEVTGHLSALFVSVFYLQVFFSRQARFYQLFQLMFFLTVFLVYKSRKKDWLIYPALVSFLVAYDSQTAGYILAPFLIGFILYYRRKQWYLALIPGTVLVFKFLPILGIADPGMASTFASAYLDKLAQNWYWFLLMLPGIWFGLKKKEYTLYVIVPSITLLVGVFFAGFFATRYAFFFAFPMLLFVAVLFGWLYEKFGKHSLIAVAVLLFVSSNIVFPLTYTVMIKPVDYGLYDPTMPVVDLKNLPQDVIEEIKDKVLVTYFSPSAEWYIKKPDFVIPFSMSGKGAIMEYNGVDAYSGAPYLLERPGDYVLISDEFSVVKLNDTQKKLHRSLIEGCLRSDYGDVYVYKCS